MSDFFSASAPYVVYFSDPDEYDFAVAISGGTQLWTSPFNAASIFDIAWPPPTTIGAKGIYAASDEFSITSPTEINNPAPSGIFMDPEVDSVEVPSQIPNPDPQIPTDSKPTLFQWFGFIARGGSASIEDPPPDFDNIPQRRWIGGFEYFDQGEGETNSIKSCRDASRTVEGFGGALRNDAAASWLRTVDKYRTGLTPSISVERFYIRVRNIGNTPIDIWKCRGNPSVNAGTRLYLDTDGTVKVYNVTSAPVETLMATSTFSLVPDYWYQFQLAFTYNTAASGGAGAFGLKLIGEQVLDRVNEVCNYEVPAADGGMGQNSSTHSGSQLGVVLTGTDNLWEIDLDDWICTDYPNNGDHDPTSLDFVTGSHVKSVRTVAIGALQTGWTGELDFENQMLNPSAVTTTSQITSSTAVAILDGVTDADDGGIDDPTGVSFGAVAAIINKYGLRLGTEDGQLGYSIAGAPEVLTPITEFGSAQYATVAYLPTPTPLPTSIVPFDVIHEKGNSTDLATVRGLSAIVEYIGIWGPEDDQEGVMEFKPVNYHNCHYPRYAASVTTPDPSAPVARVGGTYVGNDTTTVLSFTVPPHFIMIRPLTGGSGGAIWFSTGFGGHLLGQEGVLPPHMVRVFEYGGTCYVVLTGTLPNINANGVTYQYTAFCDPTMRYNLCSSLMHDGTVVSTADYPLIIDSWEPIGAFFQFELLGTGTNVKLIYKGPGHTGTEGTEVDGTDKSDVASFGTGVLTTLADIHRKQIQTTFSLWRMDDCSGFAAVQMTSFVGTGTPSKVITLPRTTGCYPLFVIVQGHGVKGWYRDASHTGTDSSDMISSGSSITAITAGGIDSITVGIDCNANAVIYDVFVIMGDTTGWNNGTFYAPTIPCDWYIEPPTVKPGNINIYAEGGLEIGGNPPVVALQDVSGIYTIVPGKTNDTLYDRQTEQTSVDVKIPDPTWKTGYIGG